MESIVGTVLGLKFWPFANVNKLLNSRRLTKMRDFRIEIRGNDLRGKWFSNGQRIIAVAKLDDGMSLSKVAESTWS